MSNDLGEGFIENSHGDEVHPTDLRVYRRLRGSLEAMDSDFTILGFRKISPIYVRGRKISATYLDKLFDEVIVEKIFEDVLDESGRLKALQITFNFYNENNEIGATKTEIVKTFNKAEVKTEMRKRRARQIDYLQAGAEDTPIETHVNAIIHHYHTEIELYKAHGVEDWNNAINSETDPIILAYLSIEVPRLDDPTKMISVKDSILYQTTGVLPE